MIGSYMVCVKPHQVDRPDSITPNQGAVCDVWVHGYDVLVRAYYRVQSAEYSAQSTEHSKQVGVRARLNSSLAGRMQMHRDTFFSDLTLTYGRRIRPGMSDISIPKYSRSLINVRITCPPGYVNQWGCGDSVTTCTANLQPCGFLLQSLGKCGGRGVKRMRF